MADKGTIFLDEVSEMSPKLQVKFLRVLQESEFERVGGGKTIHVDVRVIAATNKDLEDSVGRNEFREDLYYRLNVVPLQIPPLRDRYGYISILIQSFMEKISRKKINFLGVCCARRHAALQEYHWPGNIRELENLIERMAILAESPVLRLEDLPERFLRGRKAKSGASVEGLLDIPDDGINLKAVMEDMESKLIEKALEKSGGVKIVRPNCLG